MRPTTTNFRTIFIAHLIVQFIVVARARINIAAIRKKCVLVINMNVANDVLPTKTIGAISIQKRSVKEMVLCVAALVIAEDAVNTSVFLKTITLNRNIAKTTMLKATHRKIKLLIIFITLSHDLKHNFKISDLSINILNVNSAT